MLVGSMNDPSRELLAELRSFGELGLDFVDLTVEGPQATPEIVRRLRPRLEGLLASHGMGLTVHMPWYLQIASPFASVRQAFLHEAVQVVELAAELGAPLVTIHPDFLLLHRDAAQLQGPTIDSLGFLLGRAEQCGLELCLENFEKRHTSTALLAATFAALPGLKLTLDVGHAWMGERALGHLRWLLDTFGDRLAHVHLHDNRGQRDEHLPLGVGNIDLAGTVAALKGAGYDGRITLEVHAPDRDYLGLSVKKLRSAWQAQAALRPPGEA